MAETDQFTKGMIKLFGATISIQESKPKKEETNEEEKREIKRPDKIVPCPRCRSMETKFCYFNNYNVNQPRHFCKACQRYWTAGGALRNVPFGAGRRKSKPAAAGDHSMVDDCLFDDSGMYRYEFNPGAVVETWRVMEHGQLRHDFPAKRRR